MGITGKNESKVQRFVLSCDAVTTGCLAMCLLFAAPYVVSVCGTLALWFLPIACLLPFAALPLFYMLVHRVDTLLFGRYHLLMPLAGFVSALFFVIMWSATDGSAGMCCATFFGAAVFLTAATVYRYCAFSVRARLLDRDFTAPSPHGLFFTFAGAVAVVVTFFVFRYFDASDAYLNTAYVMGAAVTVVTLVQYLYTYYNIPRLGGKRVQSVKNVFRSFFSELDLRTFFSALLFNAAFATLAATGVFFAFAAGFDSWRIAVVVSAIIGSYTLVEIVCAYFIKRRSMALSVGGFVVFVLSAACLIFASCIDMPIKGVFACVTASAVLAGTGGAVVVRQTGLRLLTIKPRITSGTVFVLLELVACAAGAIALTVVALIAELLNATYAVAVFACGGGAAAVFAVSAFACAGKKRMRRADAPQLSYEPDTGELYASVGNGDNVDDE